RTRTLELAAYPQVAPLIESIRATLAGDRTTLERIFSVRFDGDLAHWTLILAPRDAAAARTVRQVRIAGERAALQSVEIVQPDGDRSLLSLGPDLSR
ncbi:MAG: LolA-related protein, partial [Steroidobacteraceae bacterium]